MRPLRVAVVAGCWCTLAVPAMADQVTMRFQGRIEPPIWDDLDLFDFPDSQRTLWGRIVVDTDAPGRVIHAHGTAYDLVSIEVNIGGQLFVADTLRELTILNDNPEPGFEDVFRFDGFIGDGSDVVHIESATYGLIDWLSSQAIPDLATIRIDPPLVHTAWIAINQRGNFGDQSTVNARITTWRIVPGPAGGTLAGIGLALIAGRRRQR